MNCCEQNIIEYPQIFKNGITHIRQECTECKKFLGWKPQNKPFKLWFGKHKGKLLSEVDEDYLDYLLTLDISKKLRDKLENYLYTNKED